MLYPELLQIYSFVTMNCDHVVVKFLIVSDEQVFGIGLRVGELDLSYFSHVEHCRVFDHFIIDAARCQVFVCLLFSHMILPVLSLQIGMHLTAC